MIEKKCISTYDKTVVILSLWVVGGMFQELGRDGFCFEGLNCSTIETLIWRLKRSDLT